LRIFVLEFFYFSKKLVLKRYHHNYWVYILCNKPNGVLYVGVTGGLEDRIERHTKGEGSKYNVHRLVYFEEYQYINDAIAREKKLKKWKRQWKIELIEKNNPVWKDLMSTTL